MDVAAKEYIIASFMAAGLRNPLDQIPKMFAPFSYMTPKYVKIGSRFIKYQTDHNNWLLIPADLCLDVCKISYSDLNFKIFTSDFNSCELNVLLNLTLVV